MSLAILFPGQGSQQPGMLHALPDSPAARAVLDESCRQLADLGLPADLDTAAALRDTTNVQIALLIAGVACARALIEDQALRPEFVAGHSVGAYAAAVTAGVLTLAEALRAVAVRGRLMKEVCSGRDWGMAALKGLPTRAATQLAQRVSTADEPLWVANINSASQTVLSGATVALERAEHAAAAAGAAAYELLEVDVASHCPLQASTAARLAAHLAVVPRREPTAGFLTNTRGRVVTTAEAVLDDLAQAVAHPVQWYDGIRLIAELGATTAIETRPGHVLTRLVSLSTPTMTAIALQDTALSVAAAQLRKWIGPA